jgi:hypothetical protein
MNRQLMVATLTLEDGRPRVGIRGTWAKARAVQGLSQAINTITVEAADAPSSVANVAAVDAIAKATTTATDERRRGWRRVQAGDEKKAKEGPDTRNVTRGGIADTYSRLPRLPPLRLYCRINGGRGDT